MRRLRVGIVGWNSEVRAYLSFVDDGLISDVEVRAIYVQAQSIRGEIEADYPLIPIYHHYREMMDKEKIEAVLSFHPTLHYSR